MSTTTVEFKSLLPYLHKVIDSHDLTGLLIDGENDFNYRYVCMDGVIVSYAWREEYGVVDVFMPEVTPGVSMTVDTGITVEMFDDEYSQYVDGDVPLVSVCFVTHDISAFVTMQGLLDTYLKKKM